MSYDLYLVPADAGAPLEREFERLMGEQEEDADPGPIDPAAEARKQEMAAALEAINPELERFAFDYGQIAGPLNCSEAEARRRFRHIELTSRDEKSPVQVTLHDDHVAIAIAYWHTGERAQQTMAQVWRYCDAIRRGWGWRVYDPQEGCEHTSQADFERAVRHCSRISGTLQQATAPGASRSPDPEVRRLHKAMRRAGKPWWKFW